MARLRGSCGDDWAAEGHICCDKAKAWGIVVGGIVRLAALSLGKPGAPAAEARADVYQVGQAAAEALKKLYRSPGIFDIEGGLHIMGIARPI